MSTLSEFSLDEVSLALSLVVDWQLEKVKEQPLYAQWSEAMESVTIPGIVARDDEYHRPWNGISLYKDQTTIKCKGKDVFLRGEVDVQEEEYFIIVRAMFKDYKREIQLLNLEQPQFHDRIGCPRSDLYCVSCSLELLRPIGADEIVSHVQSDAATSGLNHLVGTAFTHTHYKWAGRYQSPRRPEPDDHLAMVRISLLQRPSFITLKMDIQTDEGRRICQQIITDLGYFWIGQPVEYLALYTRDWLSKGFQAMPWIKGQPAAYPQKVEWAEPDWESERSESGRSEQEVSEEEYSEDSHSPDSGTEEEESDDEGENAELDK